MHARIQRADRGSRPPPPPNLKNHKRNITSPDPLKSQSYQANIQCWAIIGTPPKRHLNGVSLVGRWRPAYSGIWILSQPIN